MTHDFRRAIASLQPTLCLLLALFGGQPVHGQSVEDPAIAIVALVGEADAAIARTDYTAATERLDTAWSLLDSAQNPALEHLVLNSLAALYYANEQLDLAGDFYRRLIALDEQRGDETALAISTYNMGHVAASQQHFSDAERLFGRSLDLSRRLRDNSGEAYAWKALGVNAQAMGDLRKTEYMLGSALTLFTELGDDGQRAAVLRHLGDIAIEQRLPGQALSYYQQALPLLQAQGLSQALIRTYRGLALAHEQTGDLAGALANQRTYYELQLQELQQKGDTATVKLREQLDLRHYIDTNDRLERQSAEQQQLLHMQLLVLLFAGSCVLLLGCLLWRGIQQARLLHDLATTDELTKVMNRRALLAHGRREWQRAQRYGQAVTCLAFDIDHFKSINDSFGHATGDIVLKAVAATLKSMLRQTDCVGRIGGEEFLLIAGDTDPVQAQILAERIRLTIAAMEFDALAGRRVTVSIGIAGYQPGLDFDTAVQRADKALYQAKHSGRNRCALYHSTLDVLPAPLPSLSLQPQLQLV